MAEWISVTERLPDEDTDVLVVRKFIGIKGQVPPSTYVEIASLRDDRWFADSDEYKIARSLHTDPLYWMPVPKPPKDVAERLTDSFVEKATELQKAYDNGQELRPVVHGYWVNEPAKIPRCSVCGRYSDDADTGEAKWCAFCGAKMEEQT